MKGTDFLLCDNLIIRKHLDINIVIHQGIIQQVCSTKCDHAVTCLVVRHYSQYFILN
jgi:hypothetical protein